MTRSSVPYFESLMDKAIRCYRAGDLRGADDAFKEWITARRTEYELSKSDFNDGYCSFEALEKVRIALECAESAFLDFHELVEEKMNAERTEIETRH